MSDEPKKVDINEPVEQGQDLVLNHADGSQTLGDEKARDAADDLQGLHTNPLPKEEVETPKETKAKEAKK